MESSWIRRHWWKVAFAALAVATLLVVAAALTRPSAGIEAPYFGPGMFDHILKK